MRLSISTPLENVVDADNVAYVRAEDETGAFGILPGHTDFLTVLAVSVLTWRDLTGIEHYVAVRGGVLEVRGASTAVVATPQAVCSDELHRLEAEVLALFRRAAEEDRIARVDAERLYLAAIRQICHYLRPEPAPAVPGGPAIKRPGRLNS